jgi:hypothetical protein
MTWLLGRRCLQERPEIKWGKGSGKENEAEVNM